MTTELIYDLPDRNTVNLLQDSRINLFTSNETDRTYQLDATNITERRFFKIYNSVRKGLKELDPDTKKAVIEVFKRLAYYEKLTILKKGNE